MGIKRVTSSTPCLISVMRVERSVLTEVFSLGKSTPDANKFITVQGYKGKRPQPRRLTNNLLIILLLRAGLLCPTPRSP
eukprot:756079-Pelagomonas_calceolata.AAC.1